MSSGAPILHLLAVVALAQAPAVDTLAVVPVVDQPLPRIEGRKKHLSPAAARDVRVEVCPQHFPRGTRAWQNLVTAVDRLNAARRVGLKLTVYPARAHLPHRKLYAPPRPGDPATIRVDYATENPKGGTLNASGAAFQFHARSRGWRWGDDGQDLATDAAVVALNPERGFKRHHAAPRRSDRGYEPADAPSLGVFSHEIGHALGFGHDEKRRIPQLVGHAVHRGAGRWVTDGVKADGTARPSADQRQGRIHAYTQWALEKRYPDARAPDDTKPEWHLHEVIAFPTTLPARGDDHHPVPPVTKTKHPPKAYELDDLVPRLLRATPTGHVDCRTGQPPVLVVQYSDTSNVKQEGTVRATVQLGDHTIAEREHPAQDPRADYVQYTWTRTLEVPAALNRARKPVAMPLTIRVGDPSSELDPADNTYTTQVWLFPEATKDRRCLAAAADLPR